MKEKLHQLFAFLPSKDGNEFHLNYQPRKKIQPQIGIFKDLPKIKINKLLISEYQKNHSESCRKTNSNNSFLEDDVKNIITNSNNTQRSIDHHLTDQICYPNIYRNNFTIRDSKSPFRRKFNKNKNLLSMKYINLLEEKNKNEQCDLLSKMIEIEDNCFEKEIFDTIKDIKTKEKFRNEIKNINNQNEYKIKQLILSPEILNTNKDALLSVEQIPDESIFSYATEIYIEYLKTNDNNNINKENNNNINKENNKENNNKVNNYKEYNNININKENNFLVIHNVFLEFAKNAAKEKIEIRNQYNQVLSVEYIEKLLNNEIRKLHLAVLKYYNLIDKLQKKEKLQNNNKTNSFSSNNTSINISTFLESLNPKTNINSNVENYKVFKDKKTNNQNLNVIRRNNDNNSYEKTYITGINKRYPILMNYKNYEMNSKSINDNKNNIPNNNISIIENKTIETSNKKDYKVVDNKIESIKYNGNCFQLPKIPQSNKNRYMQNYNNGNFDNNIKINNNIDQNERSKNYDDILAKLDYGEKKTNTNKKIEKNEKENVKKIYNEEYKKDYINENKKNINVNEKNNNRIENGNVNNKSGSENKKNENVDKNKLNDNIGNKQKINNSINQKTNLIENSKNNEKNINKKSNNVENNKNKKINETKIENKNDNKNKVNRNIRHDNLNKNEKKLLILGNFNVLTVINKDKEKNDEVNIIVNNMSPQINIENTSPDENIIIEDNENNNNDENSNQDNDNDENNNDEYNIDNNNEENNNEENNNEENNNEENNNNENNNEENNNEENNNEENNNEENNNNENNNEENNNEENNNEDNNEENNNNNETNNDENNNENNNDENNNKEDNNNEINNDESNKNNNKEENNKNNNNEENKKNNDKNNNKENKDKAVKEIVKNNIPIKSNDDKKRLDEMNSQKKNIIPPKDIPNNQPTKPNLLDNNLNKNNEKIDNNISSKQNKIENQLQNNEILKDTNKFESPNKPKRSKQHKTTKSNTKNFPKIETPKNIKTQSNISSSTKLNYKQNNVEQIGMPEIPENSKNSKKNSIQFIETKEIRQSSPVRKKSNVSSNKESSNKNPKSRQIIDNENQIAKKNAKSKEKDEKKNEFPTLIFKYRPNKRKKTRKSRKKTKKHSKLEIQTEPLDKKEDNTDKKEIKPLSLNENTLEKISSSENEENSSDSEDGSNVVTLKDDDIDNIIEFIDKAESKKENEENNENQVHNNENKNNNDNNNDNKTFNNNLNKKPEKKKKKDKKKNRKIFLEKLKRDDTMIKLYLEKMVRDGLILEKKKNDFYKEKSNNFMDEEEKQQKKQKLLFLQQARNKILARNFNEKKPDDEKLKIEIDYPKEVDDEDEDEDNNSENKKTETEQQKTTSSHKKYKRRQHSDYDYFDYNKEIIYDNQYVMEKYKKKLDGKDAKVKKEILDIINDESSSKNERRKSKTDEDYLSQVDMFSRYSESNKKKKKKKKRISADGKINRKVLEDENADKDVLEKFQTEREKYEQKQRELEMKDKILQNKIRDFFNKIKQLKDQKIEDLIEVDRMAEVDLNNYTELKEKEKRIKIFLSDLKDYRTAKKYQRKYLDTIKYKNPLLMENFLACDNNNDNSSFNQNKTYINCSNFVSHNYSDDENNTIQQNTQNKLQSKSRKKTMYLTALFNKKLRHILNSMNK